MIHEPAPLDAEEKRASAAAGDTRSSGAAADGAAAQFRTLFIAQFGAMVALARLLGAEDPDSVAQEAFLRVYARWASLRDPAAAPAYLRRIVVNLSKNSLRHRMIRRRRRRPLQEAPPVPSAEASTLARADLAAVLTAIAALPRKRREALVLRHWLGLSYQEIANALGVSPGAARSLNHRAISEIEHIIDHTEEQP